MTFTCFLGHEADESERVYDSHRRTFCRECYNRRRNIRQRAWRRRQGVSHQSEWWSRMIPLLRHLFGVTVGREASGNQLKE